MRAGGSGCRHLGGGVRITAFRPFLIVAGVGHRVPHVPWRRNGQRANGVRRNKGVVAAKLTFLAFICASLACAIYALWVVHGHGMTAIDRSGVWTLSLVAIALGTCSVWSAVRKS